jgi:hypothetical protein
MKNHSAIMPECILSSIFLGGTFVSYVYIYV